MSDLASVLAEVADRQGRFPALQTLLHLRRSGLPLDEETCALLARRFERRSADIKKIAEWIEKLGECSSSGAKAHRCVSVSCSAQGAATLWADIGPICEELGLSDAIEEVHCLDHCDRGPSLGVGDEVYVGRDDEVVTDERPFRSEPFSFEA